MPYTCPVCNANYNMTTHSLTNCFKCGTGTTSLTCCKKCSDDHKICIMCHGSIKNADYYVKQINNIIESYRKNYKFPGVERIFTRMNKIIDFIKDKTYEEILEHCLHK